MLPRSARVALAGLAALLLAACGGPDPTVTPTTVPAARPTATAPVSVPATDEPATPEPVSGEPPSLALELVARGLDAPIGMAVANDGSGRLFVHERGGRVRIVEADGRLTGDPFVDLSARIEAGGERGLLGLAFHPDYPANGRLFVHYSRRGDGATVVSELAAAPDRASADPASERILLTAPQPYGNHNGGQLAFGPDGYLYIGLGDGGSGGDPERNGQNPATLLGTLLRIDVDASPAPGLAYATPPDNPFVAGGGTPEVWVFGLRNPWRFSFDRMTGELWIADVGQSAWEEVNRLPAGEGGQNLGWNAMEGGHCFGSDSCDASAFTLPLAEYGHDQGCSVTGGYVYRGGAHPSMSGWYLFGDYCSGTIFGVPSDLEPPPGEVASPERLLATDRRISAFGQGEDGELYLVEIAGGLYRIVAGD